MDKYLNFSQFLTGVNDGSFHEELTDKLRDLVAKMSDAFQENGGNQTGSISIKLGFKLEKGGVFEIVPDAKVTEPATVRGKTVCWATPDNFLTKVNPRQGKLPLHDVSPIRREFEA